MALMEWPGNLVLDVSQMDETHREFVEQLNALAESADADMLQVFDQLYAHTVAHFEQENEWMRTYCFPMSHCHGAEHDGVLEVMREVRGHLLDAKYEVGRVLAREMAEWFRSHIATMDAMLAHYIREREPAARAVA